AAAFEPLLPLLVQQLPLLLDVGRRRQVQLQRRRRKRRQHLLADEAVQPPARQTLTFRLAIRSGGADAAVTQGATAVSVVDHQPTAAASADEQATQQRRPTPRRAACLLAGAIAPQTLLISLEALRADVGGATARQQHQALRRRPRHPAGVRLLGPLPA